METKKESSSNKMKDHVIRIEDGVIINGQKENDKMTSAEWKEVFSKVKTVRIWHDDMWDIPNDLNVLDVHRINPVTSDEEILEETLLSVRSAAKRNCEAVMQHKDSLPESVIEQLRMRGFDVRFYGDWVAICW